MDKEIVRAVASGDLKSAVAILAVNYLDKQQFAKMFVEAGKAVADYERDGSEQSDLRAVAFSESNMRQMAAHMHTVDDYQWLQELHHCTETLLSENAMSQQNKKICEKHFCDVIETKLRSMLPQIYGRSQISSISGQVADVGARMETMETYLHEILEQGEIFQSMMCKLKESRQHQRQEHSESEETVREKTDYQIPKWRLTHRFVQGVFSPVEERETEIRSLQELWRQEREAYPGWYILPPEVCEELELKTAEKGLLQSHTTADVHSMLSFTHELVWRYEKCFHVYSEYETANVHIIWDQYARLIQNHNNTETEEIISQEEMQEWFYIGQALLRIYRENGRDSKWKTVYRVLKDYEAYGLNGRIELLLERAKFQFHHLQISALRRELSMCRPEKEQYEQRLQLLGLRTECGEAKTVIEEIKQLIQDIRTACTENMSEQYRVFCMTLQTSALQLLSLCIQGMYDHKEQYEACQEEINRLLAEIDRKRTLFDWDSWKNQTNYELLRWHTEKYEEKEAFELDRETVTLFGGSGCCEDAYRFYRVLERLALPLRCGYISVLGGMERPWIEALLDQNDMLGLFMIIRGNNSDTVKCLIDRDYVTLLETERARHVVEYLLDVLEGNLEEINGISQTEMRNAVHGIQENVPGLLIRFMSRCPEALQKKAMLLLKHLMEDEDLPVSFPMAELMIGILECMSEKKKAQMMGIMLETKIVEHKTMYGHGEGIDLFDCYFRKKDIGQLRQYCVPDPEVIEQLLEETWSTEYEWRTKVIRLKTLDDLNLLNKEQKLDYAKLLWSNTAKETGLPKLPNLHLFVYEILPCTDKKIPVRSVKAYFLNQELSILMQEAGRNITMGQIRYLDELILVCGNLPKGYWSSEEAQYLLKNILAYWRKLSAKWNEQAEDSIEWDEYGSRAQKIVRAMAAVMANTPVIPEKETGNEIKRMIEEMQQYGISTRMLEIQILQEKALTDKIKAEMLSPHHNLTVGALSAAYSYISMYPAEKESQDLLEAVLQIIHYRKTPGLVSAVWVLHNLVYEKNPVLNETYLEKTDHCLKEIGETIQPGRYENGLRGKDIVNIRQACAALAYQMYHWKEDSAGEGVLLWKEITSDGEGEVNEVRNEWVW